MERQFKLIDRRRLTDLLGLSCVSAMLFLHLLNTPHIFDIEFADETIYLGHAIVPPPGLMRSYELSGLYSLCYRFLHLFVGDTVALYLWGGSIILTVCGFAIYASVRVLSGSAAFGMTVCSAFIFSGALDVWPRSSYAAIAFAALGLICAHFVRPWLAKACLLMLSAFLMAFIRPEFVLAFYVAVFASVALAIYEVFGAVRAHHTRRLVQCDLLPAWLSIAAVLALVEIWSLPVLQDNARAFIAFGQHYSLRYVNEHHLSINPWQNFTQIIGPLFPRARTVGEAARAAPGLYAEFLVHNTIDSLRTLGGFLSEWLRPHTGAIRAIAGTACIFAAMLWVGRPSIRTHTKEHLPRNFVLTDAAAVSILMAPPLLASVAVYPRLHYLIIVLFFLFEGLGLIWRYAGCKVPTRAVLLLGVGLVLTTPVLPRVDQPVVKSIMSVRAQPGIKSMLEADLGWCFYYVPPCIAIWPRPGGTFESFSKPFSLSKRVEEANPDAIMVSNGLLAIVGVKDDPLYKTLMSDPHSVGFEAINLPQQRTLLLKR